MQSSGTIPRNSPAKFAAGVFGARAGGSNVQQILSGEFGAGLALPGDASVEAIRAAAQQILSTPSFKQNARERAKALAGVDGAANAADEVESLLDAVPSRGDTDARRQCVA